MSPPVITVELQLQADGRVEVQTKTSLAGQSQAVVVPPFREPLQRQAVAVALEAVRFEPAAWQNSPALFQALKDLGLGSDAGFTSLREGVGKALFEAFFPTGGLREALRANLNAATAKAPARIELIFRAEDADMGAYPWELLFDPDRDFLFSSRRSALIRYVACPLPVPKLMTSDALNLLLVTARPISQPADPIQLPLLVDAEGKAIEEGLAEPLKSGAIHLEPLPAATSSKSTWELLNDYLTTHSAAQAPHILHFDGHGGYGRRCASAPAGCGLLNPAGDTVCRGCGRHLDGPAQGYLAFEARNRRPHWVSAREVSNLLIDAGVRLAVLTACKSAVVAGRSVFSGMGPALIQAGVPAVVAVQFSITADAARSFTRSFYLALAQYAPLTRAMSQARAALFADETTWYRPVLYLRTDAKNPDGKLFARKSKPKPKPAPAPTAALTVVVPSPAPPPADAPTLLRRILSNLDLTRVAFDQQVGRRNSLCARLRDRLGNIPTPNPIFEGEDGSGEEGEWHRQWEAFFYQYYDQLTPGEMFDFRQIRAITETTLQVRNRETRKLLEDNPALIDAIPDLNALRIHLEVWVNKYDGLFVNMPQMCVLYVGAVDGVPFPRGVEQSIRSWLAPPLSPPPPIPPAVVKPKPGEPCPQSTMNRTDLRNAIVQYFSREELDVLCADVQADLEAGGINEQVNVDIVGGSGKTAIVLNLITFLERRGQLGCLEVVAQRMRPNAFQR